MKYSYFFLFLSFFLTSCSNDEKPIEDNYSVDVILSPANGGEVKFTSQGPYLKGETVHIIAVPFINYKFSHWEGDLEGEQASQSLVITKNFSIIAVFIPLESFAKENVVLYNDVLIDNSGYFFMMENGQKDAYLVNHQGDKVKEWQFEDRMGNDLEITPSGNLLGCFKVSEPNLSFGGFGGHIKMFNPTGSLIWEYVVNSSNEIAHHDATQLPNGNIVILLWERINKATLESSGISVDHDVFTEKLIEVNPLNNSIVWQWRSWEHIIQDLDASKPSYGIISEHPNKINISYNDLANGDWMHANGIFYDTVTDLLYMSVNFYSEVWVIDHSSTLDEASSSVGGNYNRGGDLVYRFGNPTVFGLTNSVNSRFLYNNHHPSVVPVGYPGESNFLIYNNGSNNKQSIAYELKLPSLSNSSMQEYISPSVVWSFTDPTMYFDKISGLQRLPNGNTLICEGDYGYWEVTSQGEVVWKYDGLGKSFWRGYYYLKNDPRLLEYGLGD